MFLNYINSKKATAKNVGFLKAIREKRDAEG